MPARDPLHSAPRKAAELVCFAASYRNCCLFQQLQVSAVRRRRRVRRYREIGPRLDVRRCREIRHLELHAKPKHEKLGPAMSAGHCYVQLPYGQRWAARRWNGERQRSREPVHRRRLGRRCCDRTRAQVRRGICRRLRSQSDDRPSRGCSPSRPMGPCPGRCRCRSTPVRNNPWGRTGRAHSHSSRTDSSVERRCQLQVALELLAPAPNRRAAPSFRIKS